MPELHLHNECVAPCRYLFSPVGGGGEEKKELSQFSYSVTNVDVESEYTYLRVNASLFTFLRAQQSLFFFLTAPQNSHKKYVNLC